jgi:cell division septum initiation protein DivIVA
MRCILDSDDEVNKYLNEVKTRLQTTRAEKAQLISEIAKIQQTWEFHQKDFDTKMEILIVERRESEKKKNNPNGKVNL